MVLTIGADPEFGFLEEGKRFRPACNYLQYEGKFGTDGCSSIAEIRPPPAYDPLGLVENIRAVLRDGVLGNGVKWIPLKNEWHAGTLAGRCPIGGHIHFGVERKPELIESLDTYLAHTLALLEKEERARLRRGRWGGLGAARDQPHGFEYRPPASWLVSPEITAGVLCLAYAVVSGSVGGRLNNGHTTNNAKFIGHEYDYLRDIHEEAKREVVKLQEYKEYQPHIDYIYSLIRRKQTWNDDADIRQTWGFVRRFEGMKSYAFEDPDQVFNLRRVALSPAGYSSLSLSLDFNWKDAKLPEIHHALQSLIEVRDDGLPLELDCFKLPFYGLLDDPDRPQIRINGKIPRARKICSFLRRRGYAVEVVPKSCHAGIGLRADLRRDVGESARLVLFCALSASGLTRLGRRERFVEYGVR